MSNEVKGTIKFIGQVETGTGKTGKEWSKRMFVITTDDSQYPKDIAFILMGDKTAYIDKYPVGSVVSVKYDVSSNEFNGKWYTSANAFSVFGEASGQANTGNAPKEEPKEDDPSSDLPF